MLSTGLYNAYGYSISPRPFFIVCVNSQDKSIWTSSEGDFGSEILERKNSYERVHFETPRRIAREVKFGVERGLAGFQTGHLDLDEFFELCAIDDNTFDSYVSNDGAKLDVLFEKKIKFPLLYTIK